MQQDEHRGLVAGVESHRIPDGEGEVRDGILWDEVWDELVRQLNRGCMDAMFSMGEGSRATYGRSQSAKRGWKL